MLQGNVYGDQAERNNHLKARNSRRKGSGSDHIQADRYWNLRMSIDLALRRAKQDVEIQAQHGPVKILVKDGKLV